MIFLLKNTLKSLRQHPGPKCSDYNDRVPPNFCRALFLPKYAQRVSKAVQKNVMSSWRLTQFQKIYQVAYFLLFLSYFLVTVNQYSLFACKTVLYIQYVRLWYVEIICCYIIYGLHHTPMGQKGPKSTLFLCWRPRISIWYIS